jgi:hypothetical protein
VIRATATFLAIVGALVLATAASAEVVPRLADLEIKTSSPYDFDQASRHCTTSTISRETSSAYSGGASLKVHTDDSTCTGPYSRGIFRSNSTRHLVGGDDFWMGMAIYLPSGFYSAHDGYTDLMRVDSYVYDNSSNVPYDDRAEINFASWGNDNLYVRAARGGTVRTLLGPLSPSALPEGKWNWVEVHVKLSATGGTAYTELKVNGSSLGSSKTANLFAGAAPLNRLRYGIVSTESPGSGDLTAYVDRASLTTTERGPLSQSPPPPPEEPAPAPGSGPTRIGFWRLDETGGTTAADATGNAPGAYLNGPALGVPRLSSSGFGTAVSFDGVNDQVEIAPANPLNVSEEVSIEAWCKAYEFNGSVAQRYGAYELRPQPNGNLIWRIWIDGAAQSLTAGAGKVSTGQAHHIAGTYDGERMDLYLDGARVATQAMSGPIAQGTGYPLYIGRNANANTYFGGTIDDVAIYSGALSAATVLDHFQRGTLLGQP